MTDRNSPIPWNLLISIYLESKDAGDIRSILHFQTDNLITTHIGTVAYLGHGEKKKTIQLIRPGEILIRPGGIANLPGRNSLSAQAE